MAKLTYDEIMSMMREGITNELIEEVIEDMGLKEEIVVISAKEAREKSDTQRKRTIKNYNLEKYEKLVLELLHKKIVKSVAKGDNKLFYKISHDIFEFHRNGLDSDKINLGKSVIEEVASQLRTLGYEVKTGMDAIPKRHMIDRGYGITMPKDYLVYSTVELEW